MKTPADDFELVLAAQLREVHGIARDADRKLRVFLGVLHGVFEHLAVQHVDVQVVCALGEIAVEHRHEVLDTLSGRRAERFGHDREGVRNTVLRVAVAHLGHRGDDDHVQKWFWRRSLHRRYSEHARARPCGKR